MTKEKILCMKEYQFKSLIIIYQNQIFDLPDSMVVKSVTRFEIYSIWYDWFSSENDNPLSMHQLCIQKLKLYTQILCISGALV